MSRSSMHVSSATFAYPDVDGAVRADLTASLVPPPPGAGVFVLSTCLRLEVVVEGAIDRLESVLSELFPGIEAARSAKVRHGEASVEHLFRVAAGLESPIRGEREILTQFRQSVSEAFEGGHIDGIFSKLFETAVAVARSARDLLPDAPHDSMAAVAAQAAGTADRVAVLGSGAMATAVVRGLHGLPAPPQITVVARTPERVIDGDVAVWSFDHAAAALAEFPVVISATSARQRLLSDDELAAIVRGRTRPLTLIDMAMPPDLPRSVSPAVHYLDIDDLARMADRRPRGEEADELVRDAARDAHRGYVEHHEIGPVIGSLLRAADEIVGATVDRFRGRLTEDGDEAVLRQTAHTVARTLLAGPIAYIKQPTRAPEAVDVVADAFGVDA